MSNWFQDHPATTVITHTFAVAGITWAISFFILDSNKIDNLQTEIRTLETKAEVLSSDNSVLRDKVSRYEDILMHSPGTVQYFQSQIESLTTAAAAAQSTRVSDGAPVAPYRFSATLSTGEAFIDPRTGVILGVTEIVRDNHATGTVTIPGLPASSKFTNAEVGANWPFSMNGANYRMVLTKINWINNRYSAEVTELRPDRASQEK